MKKSSIVFCMLIISYSAFVTAKESKLACDVQKISKDGGREDSHRIFFTYDEEKNSIIKTSGEGLLVEKQSGAYFKTDEIGYVIGKPAFGEVLKISRIDGRLTDTVAGTMWAVGTCKSYNEKEKLF